MPVTTHAHNSRNGTRTWCNSRAPADNVTGSWDAVDCVACLQYGADDGSDPAYERLQRILKTQKDSLPNRIAETTGVPTGFRGSGSLARDEYWDD